MILELLMCGVNHRLGSSVALCGDAGNLIACAVACDNQYQSLNINQRLAKEGSNRRETWREDDFDIFVCEVVEVPALVAK